MGFQHARAIYNSVSKNSIANDFNQEIANKKGMQNFRLGFDFKYFYESSIPTPAYLFKISSRDMARFGLLYLNKGKWGTEQIIPSDWVQQSTSPKKTPWEGDGYGYLWWNTTLKDGSYAFITPVGRECRVYTLCLLKNW